MYQVLTGTGEEVEARLNQLVVDAKARFKADPEIVSSSVARGGPNIGPAQLFVIVRVQDPPGGIAEMMEQGMLSAIELGKKAAARKLTARETALQSRPVPAQNEVPKDQWGEWAARAQDERPTPDCFNPACIIHGSGIEEGGEG